MPNIRLLASTKVQSGFIAGSELVMVIHILVVSGLAGGDVRQPLRRIPPTALPTFILMQRRAVPLGSYAHEYLLDLCDFFWFGRWLQV